MQEHIGDFQIPMHHFLIRQLQQPLHDILNDRTRLLLREVPLLAEGTLKIAPVTQLSYDVAIALGVEHLVALEDVGVVELFQDVDLGEKQLLQLF